MGSTETYFKAASISTNPTLLHQAARVETKK